MNRICVLLLLSLGSTWQAARGVGSADRAEPQLLELQVAGPIVRSKIPLSRALSEVGRQVHHGYVLFGIEVRLIDGNEPTVNVDVRAGGMLGGALRQIFQQTTGYQFEVVSAHLINVYPTGAKDDPNDLLNLRIGRFDVVEEPPDAVMNYPEELIPKLKWSLAQRKTGPPLPVVGRSEWLVSMGPKVTLHLHNVTVRDILNAVSQASERLPGQYLPVGWIASLHTDSTSATGWAYSWKWHSSAPTTWKQQAGKPQN